VSVIATFKEAGVQGRLRLLIESESLLNDGTAAVGFVAALSVLARRASQYCVNRRVDAASPWAEAHWSRRGRFWCVVHGGPDRGLSSEDHGSRPWAAYGSHFGGPNTLASRA